jgi:peptidoglycan/xylan/chitin deacetylase (PgdA/CDA1 family)
MKSIKAIFYNAAAALPTSLLKKMAPAGTLFPYHHTVSNDHLPHIRHLYSYKNVKQFTKDIDHLLKHYKPVTVQDIINSLQEKAKLPANSFLLSFDDGFREVYHVVEPILSAKGVPATCFINPAFIDNKELFYRAKISLILEEMTKKNVALTEKISSILQCYNNEETVKQALRKIDQRNKNILDTIADSIGISFEEFLRKQQPFMTTDQLLSLHKKGFTIGGHSWNHPYYNLLNEEEQLSQTISSCRFVKENIAVSPMCFSFPHYDKGLPQSLFDKLVNTDIDLFFGTQNQKTEIHNRMLHRFNAERPEMPMSKQLNGLLLFMWLEKIMGRNKVIRHN